MDVQRLPCLASASTAAFKPTFAFVDRTRAHTPPMPCLASRVSDEIPPAGTLSLHISDEELFKDAAFGDGFMEDVLRPRNSFEYAIRPVSPLWVMGREKFAEELRNELFF